MRHFFFMVAYNSPRWTADELTNEQMYQRVQNEEKVHKIDPETAKLQSVMWKKHLMLKLLIYM